METAPRQGLAYGELITEYLQGLQLCLQGW